MVFCKNCGKEIDEKAVICPHCGVAQNNAPAVVDNGGFLYGLLGCCIPIVGLILWIVWKDSKPKSAKAAGTGFLIYVAFAVISYVIIIATGVSVAELGYY